MYNAKLLDKIEMFAENLNRIKCLYKERGFLFCFVCVCVNFDFNANKNN